MDGLFYSEELILDLKQNLESARCLNPKAPPPGLAVIRLGNDPASGVYVKKKKAMAERLGYVVQEFRPLLESALIEIIQDLNEDPKVHGILLQLPLPFGMKTEGLLACIKPEKDVDGFHAYNIGRLVQNQAALRPCTPAGVLYLVKRLKIELSGLSAVVLGRSQIVGLPMALELLHQGCTVSICHSQTKDLDFKRSLKNADLLVSAMGKPEYITGDWLKPGVIAVDVGINRDAKNGRLLGDLEFESVSKVAGYISPVPGGVGPMTVAMLMKNTYEAWKAQEGISAGFLGSQN